MPCEILLTELNNILLPEFSNIKILYLVNTLGYPPWKAEFLPIVKGRNYTDFLKRLKINFFKYLFICLFLAVSGCSCSMWDLSLRHMSFSLFVACGLRSCSLWAYLPCSMWDLSSLTRDWTCIPCIGKWILSHCTTREVPRGWKLKLLSLMLSYMSNFAFLASASSVKFCSFRFPI